MAEPGDPDKAEPGTPGNEASDSGDAARRPYASDAAASEAYDHELDNLIGFTSPSALAGRERPVAATQTPEPSPETASETAPDREPEPESVIQPELVTMAAPEEPVFGLPREPDAASPEPQPVAPQPLKPEPLKPDPLEPEPDLFEPRSAYAAPAPPSDPAAPVRAPVPAWAVETPHPVAIPGRLKFGRADSPAQPLEGAMGLYTIYALILFAVPTLGVSALIALLAVTGRAEPNQPLALSHHVYQKRTLWISAIAAGLGVVLIAVNLGVFVLFLVAVWVIVRGAAGILRLSTNRPIARPKHWLI